MKSLSAKKLLKILQSNGFVISRQRGSHLILKNKEGTILPVALHGGSKSIPIGTFLAIVKQSKLPKNVFHN